jgi:UDP-3-O-[3-hydroxymyristoyl] glucosamine N-acyltransferase
MPISIKELAQRLGAEIVGDGAQEIRGVASVSSANPGDLVFVEDEQFLPAAVQSQASAIVVGEFARGKTAEKALLIARHPRLAFARAAAVILAPTKATGGIHPTATVDSGAKLGKDVAIGPYAFVGTGCRFGERTMIGAGAVAAPGVEIGADCVIHARVSIYPGTRIGNRVVVHAGAVLGSDGFGFVRDPETGRYEKFPQIGRLVIEDDVEIGAGCTIDRGALDATVIGSGTKLDNLVHIGHNAQIGKNVVIAAQTGVSGSSVLEDNVIVGGQVGIADHVRIQEGVILGAQSGIPSKKVIRGKGVVFWGTPARPIREYLKELAVLAKLARRER